jgi:hypothetical protein
MIPEDIEWDAFMSHASEDKQDFVEPLVEGGAEIWRQDMV